MKKLVPFAVLSVSVLALVGCTSTTETGGGGASPDENNKSIELVLGRLGDPFTAQIACGAEATAKEAGYTVYTSGAGVWSASDQLPFVNAATAKDPAALIIEATDTSALNQPLQAFSDTGKPVVTADSGIDQDFPAAAIGSDNYAGGQIAGETYAESVGGTGEVLIINVNPGIGVTDERQKGFEDAIAEYPGITYLGTEYAGDDPTKVSQIINAKRASNPGLNGVFATATLIGEAVGAVGASGDYDDVHFIAFDASPQEAELLRDGALDALIVQQPRLMGELSVQAAIAAIKGSEFDGEEVVDFVTITPETIDEPDMTALIYSTECE